MVLLPKALLRVRGEQLIPGEPDDEDELKEHDRRPGRRPQQLAAALAATCRSTSCRSASASLVREGDDATVVSYGRTLPLCVQAADELRQETGLTLRRARPAQHLPLRLEGDQRAACRRRAGC